MGTGSRVPGTDLPDLQIPAWLVTAAEDADVRLSASE